jgi:hypothetical protein
MRIGVKTKRHVNYLEDNPTSDKERGGICG